MSRPNLFRRMAAAIKGFGFKQWFLLILNVLLVVGSIACVLGLRFVSGALESLTAAERFQGEGETRFAQLAVFIPEGKGKSEEDIQRFRQSLDATLVEQSLEAPENGRLTIDAYCGFADVAVSSENTTGTTVKAVGVGGDFFYFHPLTLLGGSYIRSGDLMDDLVVLDEEMAWRLFGGTNLAGLTMYINGEPFVVSGVVSRETDFATQKAYAGDGGVYMSYSALSRLVETASITCYEIVMPNPIRNFAKGILEDFPADGGDLVENSSRYSLPHLWVHAHKRRDLPLLGKRRPADGGLWSAAAGAGGAAGAVSRADGAGAGHPGYPPGLSLRQGADSGEGGRGCGEAPGGASGKGI